MTITSTGENFVFAEHFGWEIWAVCRGRKRWLSTIRPIGSTGLWHCVARRIEKSTDAMFDAAKFIDTRICKSCNSIEPDGLDNSLCPACSEAAEASTSRSLYGSAGLGWESH